MLYAQCTILHISGKLLHRLAAAAGVHLRAASGDHVFTAIYTRRLK